MNENPTQKLDVAFDRYLNLRTREKEAHLVNGVPDYAFSMDQKLLQGLRAMAPVRIFFEAFTKWLVPYMKKILAMDCVAVGPNQYPELFAIGEECARRLGIGVPQIFVKYDPTMNAYTYATDNSAPVIVFHSALIDHYSLDEIRTIMGHECGHIHNQHGIYHYAAEMLTNLSLQAGTTLIPGASAVFALLSFAARIYLMRWHRCGEISCDRAGLICSPSLKTAMMAKAKLAFGGVEKLQNINFDEYIQQISQFQSTPVRFLEYFRTHPLIPKRIEALRLFNECDVFYSWRPDLKSPGLQTQPKSEIDGKCESFI